MPAVLHVENWRTVVYPNDHPPAHVHIIGPGWIVVVNILVPEMREVIGCSEREARRIVKIVAKHREALLTAWKQFHE
jgi:hypothetical protein